MAMEVFLPRLTHDMQGGRLVEWHKGEGEEVEKGEPLFAVETDKATVDVEAEASGVLHRLQFGPGDEVPVGAVMAWITEHSEALPVGAGLRAVPAGLRPAPTEGSPSPWEGLGEGEEGPGEGGEREGEGPGAAGRIVASPLARRMAREQGIDLRQIKGRGPHGRITEADVQSFLALRATARQAATVGSPARQAAPLAAGHPSDSAAEDLPGEDAPYDIAPLSPLQTTTGERIVASVRFPLPLGGVRGGVDLEIEVDMAEAARWKKCHAIQGQPTMSYTALLVCVVAHALRNHPQINATIVDGQLRGYGEINIGVTMATPDGSMAACGGLLVPVIRHADQMSLRQIQNTLSGLREKAEKGHLASADVAGGTFTLSNLGMYGFDAARAIINPPQVAILTVGRIAERPVGQDGQVVLRPTARLVLSVHHRVLDWAQAAPFLTRVRQLLENPYLLL